MTTRVITEGTIIVVVVVLFGLAFDFTNGFHDTANAMATSVATGALPPRVAVALSGVLNFVGAFLSLAVAITIATGIVNPSVITTTVVFAGLVGAITWNLVTWLFGLPSSSSHAVIGGTIGAAIVGSGWAAIQGVGIVSKVLIPALFSPIIAALAAAMSVMLAFGSSAARDPTSCSAPTASARSPRPPWCPSRTGPTTRRRPWASSPWP